MVYADNTTSDTNDLRYWQKQFQYYPNDWQIALNLSTLQVKQDAVEDALTTIEQALQHNTQQPAIWRQLGNIKRYQLNLDEAQKAYKQALQLQPHDADSMNHLGLIAYNNQQWQQAQQWFTEAVHTRPDYIGAMYNLALCYKQQSDYDQATACLLAILDAQPQHLQSYMTLGRIALQNESPQRAQWAFHKAAELFPDDTAILETITQILLDSQQYNLAKPYCQTLTQLSPNNPAAFYNLGVILEKQHAYAKALTQYQNALDIDANYYPALNNAGVVCLALEQRETAKFYFEEALRRRPDDESVRYTLSALKGESRVRAPEQYIEQLFDAYAEHFDHHLMVGLDYQIPELLRQACQPYLPNQNIDLLDLGCGTGLAAEAFHSLTRSMVGVDLSKNMLDKARNKRIFSELHQQSLPEFLMAHQAHYDVIIAGDVFTYFGDLDTIFRHCKRLLNPSGLFCFSIERNDSAGYQLQASGRFAHHPSYIEELTDIHELELVDAFDAATRQQHNEAVAGQIILLRSLD